VSSEAFDVFLSHNNKDKPAVRELAAKLKEMGLSVWLDEEQLVPGRPWQEALEKVVSTCKSVAVLVGKDGFGPWHSVEMRSCISEFVNRNLSVIPVLLPDAPSKLELPVFLKSFTWVDLRGGFTENGLQRLEWGITNVQPSPQLRTRREIWYERIRYWSRPRRIALLLLLVALTAAAIIYSLPDRPTYKDISFETFVAEINSRRQVGETSVQSEEKLHEYLKDHHYIGSRVRWTCEIIKIYPDNKKYVIGISKVAPDKDRAIADFSSNTDDFDSAPMAERKRIEGTIAKVDDFGIILTDCRFLPIDEQQ